MIINNASKSIYNQTRFKSSGKVFFFAEIPGSLNFNGYLGVPFFLSRAFCWRSYLYELAFAFWTGSKHAKRIGSRPPVRIPAGSGASCWELICITSLVKKKLLIQHAGHVRLFLKEALLTKRLLQDDIVLSNSAQILQAVFSDEVQCTK